MELSLLLCGLVIIFCIIANKISYKLGMPSLILFMIIGMLFGSDGIIKIYYDNYAITEKICSIALIFIMFYSGFGTKWNAAKPIAKEAITLSTVGVALTALLVFLFCYYVLGFNWIESFLLGSVLSPTDAASVFSILRSKNLNLKDGTASVLELESGSNDPTAYMFVLIGLSMISKGESISIIEAVIKQISFGLIIGAGIAGISIYLLNKGSQMKEGIDCMLIIAAVILSFSVAELLGGNGYLSVYITGILLGNNKIKNKINLVHFFDGVTGLAQIVIFFLLGLLSEPHKILYITPWAVLIAIFLTLIARPLMTFFILKLFKCSNKKCMLVSWAGLRGASSIVFSIMIIAKNVTLEYDIYHIVLLVSFISVLVQGSLLPIISNKLEMIDEKCDIRKTFNDYQEESDMTLMRVFISKDHPWNNKLLEEIHFPKGSLAIMIKRNNETLIPRGDTIILEDDSVILSIPTYYSEEEVNLREVVINKDSKWCNKAIADLNLSNNILIAMIKRGNKNIIPSGKSVIKENDIVVIYNN